MIRETACRCQLYHLNIQDVCVKTHVSPCVSASVHRCLRPSPGENPSGLDDSQPQAPSPGPGTSPLAKELGPPPFYAGTPGGVCVSSRTGELDADERSYLQVFCEVAYKATTRQDLLDGVDEYIDDLTVLPPSIWDPSTRLEPPEKTIQMVRTKPHNMFLMPQESVSRLIATQEKIGCVSQPRVPTYDKFISTVLWTR